MKLKRGRTSLRGRRAEPTELAADEGGGGGEHRLVEGSTAEGVGAFKTSEMRWIGGMVLEAMLGG